MESENFYTILAQPTSSDLEVSVNKFCKTGWSPLGGPVFVPNQNAIVSRDGCWYQAIVKEIVLHTSFSSGTVTSFPDVIPILPPPVAPEAKSND